MNSGVVTSPIKLHQVVSTSLTRKRSWPSRTRPRPTASSKSLSLLPVLKKHYGFAQYYVGTGPSERSTCGMKTKAPIYLLTFFSPGEILSKYGPWIRWSWQDCELGREQEINIDERTQWEVSNGTFVHAVYQNCALQKLSSSCGMVP